MKLHDGQTNRIKHMNRIKLPHGVELLGPVSKEQEEILSLQALEFFAALQREFNPRRLELLEARNQRLRAIARGEMPCPPAETRHIREGFWKVLPVPDDLQDRRVEITGPVDRKMIINALNS